MSGLRRSRRRARGWLAASVAAVAIGTSPTAPAARADIALDARFFDEAARRAYQAGRYEKALELFLQSQAALSHDRNLYNIALSAELAGHVELAFSFYRRYLDTDDEAFRAAAEQHLQSLEGRLALVEVETDPPGASIFVDDLDNGVFGTSPAVIPVRPGERTILVERPDHERASVPVVARRGQRAKTTVALVPYEGRLVIEARPAGGRLSVARQGEVVVRTVGGALDERLPVGRYTVRYERRDHVPVERTVAVVRDEDRRITLVATPTGRFGRLLVTAGRVRGDVYVDGERMGQTPATLPRVPAGRRIVEVRAPGRRTWRKEVDVEEGLAALLRATLPRQDD